jgi:hypothetical protein
METPGVLYVVACAAPAAADLARLVVLAQHDGWQVHVVTTPMGARFVDTEGLERLTGGRGRPLNGWAGVTASRIPAGYSSVRVYSRAAMLVPQRMSRLSINRRMAASGTHSMRSASHASVGGPMCVAPPARKMWCAESEMPLVGWV